MNPKQGLVLSNYRPLRGYLRFKTMLEKMGKAYA